MKKVEWWGKLAPLWQECSRWELARKCRMFLYVQGLLTEKENERVKRRLRSLEDSLRKLNDE